MKQSLTLHTPLCRYCTLGAISALLFASPAMGAIILTNGDFSAVDAATAPGWADGPFTGGMFTVAGGANGVGLSPAGSGAGLYQTFSDVSMSAVTITFDFNLMTAGSGSTPRNLDFRLLQGAAINNTADPRFIIDGAGALQYVNEASGFASFTTTGTVFSANTPDTYRFTLGVSGLDGTGGANGVISGTITKLSTGDSYSFSATHANLRAIDSMEFTKASNWGTGQQYSIDNVTVVPEPSVAVLSGLGALALLRRRRK